MTPETLFMYFFTFNQLVLLLGMFLIFRGIIDWRAEGSQSGSDSTTNPETNSANADAGAAANAAAGAASRTARDTKRDYHVGLRTLAALRYEFHHVDQCVKEFENLKRSSQSLNRTLSNGAVPVRKMPMKSMINLMRHVKVLDNKGPDRLNHRSVDRVLRVSKDYQEMAHEEERFAEVVRKIDKIRVLAAETQRNSNRQHNHISHEVKHVRTTVDDNLVELQGVLKHLERHKKDEEGEIRVAIKQLLDQRKELKDLRRDGHKLHKKIIEWKYECEVTDRSSSIDRKKMLVPKWLDALQKNHLQTNPISNQQQAAINKLHYIKTKDFEGQFDTQAYFVYLSNTKNNANDDLLRELKDIRRRWETLYNSMGVPLDNLHKFLKNVEDDKKALKRVQVRV